MTRRRTTVATLLGVVVLVVGPSAPPVAAELTAEYNWSEHAPLSGTQHDGKVRIDTDAGGVFPLLAIESPPLGGGDIVMTVDVDVVEMESPGFLELWAVYSPSERYFSRSFDQAGIGLLQSGTSQTIELPFALAGTVPQSLELNVVLPAAGNLDIGQVALHEVAAGASSPSLAAEGEWWATTTGALFGAIGGGVLGLLGALLGLLASRGRGRGFVLGSLRIGTVAGAVAAAIGIAAIVAGQPYHVWFPPLLLGALVVAVFGSQLRAIPARYEALELQKMRALDLV